jgi:hypothetical protein
MHAGAAGQAEHQVGPPQLEADGDDGSEDDRQGDCRVARVAGDLAAVFGVADLDVLSADGQLRPQSFPPNGGRALFEWAQRNGVLAAPSG